MKKQLSIWIFSITALTQQINASHTRSNVNYVPKKLEIFCNGVILGKFYQKNELLWHQSPTINWMAMPQTKKNGIKIFVGKTKATLSDASEQVMQPPPYQTSIVKELNKINTTFSNPACILQFKKSREEDRNEEEQNIIMQIVKTLKKNYQNIIEKIEQIKRKKLNSQYIVFTKDNETEEEGEV